MNKDSIKKITSMRLFLPIVCLVAVLLVNLITTPGFFKISINNGVLYGYIVDVVNRASELVILAVGMTLVTAASGGQDISVGAVIAIPVDDRKTREKFQELSKVSKLVFLSNVPENMEMNSYISCVSVNETENGNNVGRQIGEYCKNRKNVKVGFMIHGAAFYGTRARDTAAEKTLEEYYKNVDIVAIRSFGEIANAYQVCKDMIAENPDIEVLYISWDRPALLAIKALKELKREDVAVFTTDLDYEIAQCMEDGMVKGLSTQRPYEQGRTAAHVVAKALVSGEVPKYVGVQPYVVEAKQLRRAWKDIFHETMPDRLSDAVTK